MFYGTDFVKRLTKKQLEHFFEKYRLGKILMVNHSKGSSLGTCIYAKTALQSECFVCYDEFLSGKTGNVTGQDWKVFLKGIFGEPYVKMLGIEDVSNPFVSRLTENDIRRLLNVPTDIPIEECEALIQGTRRFKVQYAVMFEFIIGPYEASYSHYSMDVESFLRFMLQKFGGDYAQYYCDFAKRSIAKMKKDADSGKQELMVLKEFMTAVLAETK